ncbi:Peptidoglycan-binding Lysin subgroup [Penicillium bovifimosum]|uniref:Peptidoglycan-binding Lysin subgroup n=1 Tax=Penicillium bovifimosum TaxID=126998 RepID=A0A9W9GNJ0_9EURO|nr:Peptidoglycan-binding Lysin subgroup [Penicillium bovifimosum]KAJ5124095.1 Peptidoglycan-binding Lysin subgroup [Penicillium bovifimosum]
MTCPSILSTRGDTCESLSRRCGVSEDYLLIFNGNSTCSTLPLGLPVCCSDGARQLPPTGNGALCYVYTIEHGDTCAQLADGFGITVPEIVKWNKNTTGWNGCNHLEDGGRICLSAGEPPMPVALPDAVCGPRCSVWGKCGTGPDFCGSAAAGDAVPKASSKETNAMTAIIPKASAKEVNGVTTVLRATTKAGTAAIAVIPKASTKGVEAVTSIVSKASTKEGKATTPVIPMASTKHVEAVTSIVSKASTKESKAATTAIPTVTPEFFNGIIALPLATTNEVNSITTGPKTTTIQATSTITVDTVTPGPAEKKLDFDLLNPLLFIMSVAKLESAGKDATTTVPTQSTTSKATATTLISTTKPSTSVATTLTTATKTNDNPPSTNAAGVVTVPTGWSLTMYGGWDCSGNYMVFEGHNKKLDDSDCMLIGKDSTLRSVLNDTAVSCRWWIEGGNDWLPCSESYMSVKPNSWVMSNGLCTVSPNKKCDNYNDIAETYGWRGTGNCQNRRTMDPAFGSMKCYVG